MKGFGLDLNALRVFVTVVDAGSFSAAAKQLGRSQSAISYIVRELEATLGSDLFDRTSYRPTLSEAGQMLLTRIEHLLHDASALEAAADALKGGLEPEIVLVLDSLFPQQTLTAPLAGFARRFPQVRLRMFVEPLGAAADSVHSDFADLGVLVAFADRFEGLEPHTMSTVDLTPVAAPGHPLAQAQIAGGGVLNHTAARNHLQLVLTDRSDRTAGYDKGVHSQRTWRMTDLGLKRTLLLDGIGWGSLPHHLVADDLAAGRLMELRYARWDGYDGPPRLRAVVVHKRGRPLGPAAAWLRTRLAETSDPGQQENRS